MNPTVLYNALAARPGGGSMVWGALAAGGRDLAAGSRVIAMTGHEQVCSAIQAGDPAIETHLVEAGTGIASFTKEAGIIDGLLGADPTRIVITQNRLTRGHPGPQVVLHVNLSRFQRGTGARGWRQRPAELIRDRVARAALTDADANIFESAYLHEAATARYPDLTIANPSVAHVGLEAGWALPADAEVAPFDSRAGRLLAVTSPNPHKDNPTLIRMLGELERSKPGAWTLAIVGGHDRAVWEPELELARSLGVDGSIELLGFLDRPGLQAEIDRAAVLVSASRVESFATVPLEAMGRGVPAVVTDLASMPESVGDAGRMVAAGDAAGFAAEVLGLHETEATWAEHSRRSRDWAGAMTWDGFGQAVMKTVLGLAT